MIHINTGVYISSPRPPRGIRPVPGASNQLTRAHPKFPTSSTQLDKLPPEHHTPLTSHSSSRKGRLPLAPTSTTAVGPNRSRGKVERTHLTIEETGVKRRTSYRSAHTRRQSRPNPTMPKQDNTYWFYYSAELMHL